MQRLGCGAHRRRHALEAALAAMLVGGAMQGGAQASVPDPQVRFGPGSAQMALARQIADATWGGEPCGGVVSVTWGVLAPGVNASSTWTNPRDAWTDPLENTTCSVVLNATAEFDWPKFCTVLVHEFGHLTGHPHSPAPGDVMNAIYSQPLAACVAGPEPGVAIVSRRPGRRRPGTQ